MAPLISSKVGQVDWTIPVDFEALGEVDRRALQVVRLGLDLEQIDLLHDLSVRANSGERTAMRILAASYLTKRVPAPSWAILILRNLEASDPDDRLAKVDLATALATAGDLRGAEMRLVAASSASGQELLSNTIAHRLQELREAVRHRNSSRQYLQIRVAALQERLANDRGDTVGGTALLVKGLLRLATTTADRTVAAAALGPARVLCEARPTDVNALEMLASLTAFASTDEEWNNVLLRLEAVAPDSEYLAELRGLDRSLSIELEMEVRGRIHLAGRAALAVDSEGRDALKTLRNLCDHSAHTLAWEYLMFAENAHGNPEDALAAAATLARMANLDVANHCNLARLYQRGGRHDLAVRHLDSAETLAHDEHARTYVQALRRLLNGQTSDERS